jgi:hypothetical protein
LHSTAALAAIERNFELTKEKRVAPMPRFYLHMSDGNGFIEDEEGMDLPDEAAAREAALRCARDVMTGELRSGRLDLTSFIEVENEQRKLLFTLTFADAVQIKRDARMKED